MAHRERVTNVDKVIDRFCDRCGKQIQNGEDKNIEGIPYFRGVHMEMMKQNLKSIEFENVDEVGFSWNSGLVVQFHTKWDKADYFELCHECAEDVKLFIKKGE